MKKFIKITDLISTIFGILSGGILILSVLMVVIEIIIRTIFNNTLGITQEYMGYFMAAITFFGLSIALKDKEHIRMVFLHKIIKQGKPRFYLDLYSFVVGLIASLIVTYATFGLFWNSFVTESQAMQLSRTYLAIPQFSLVLGAALISLQFFVEILRAIVKYRNTNLYVEDSESQTLGR